MLYCIAALLDTRKRIEHHTANPVANMKSITLLLLSLCLTASALLLCDGANTASRAFKQQSQPTTVTRTTTVFHATTVPRYTTWTHPTTKTVTLTASATAQTTTTTSSSSTSTMTATTTTPASTTITDTSGLSSDKRFRVQYRCDSGTVGRYQLPALL